MQSKTGYTFAVIYFIFGSAAFTLSGIFRHQLSDFALGFCEGMSVVFMLSSAIYLAWYFIKKKHL